MTPLTETIRTFLRPQWFISELRTYGMDSWFGVPDSLLKAMTSHLPYLVDPKKHTITANEGSAIGAAVGHHLSTNNVPVVYFQNSGLGNTLNPLISCAHPGVYAIPMMLVIGWRGEPNKHDEPQHKVQGECTRSLLKCSGIPHHVLPDCEILAKKVIAEMYAKATNDQTPVALLVKRQTFCEKSLKYDSTLPFGQIKRSDTINTILDVFDQKTTQIVATTGFTSRELFQLRENRNESHKSDFLTVGSMGHASMIAFGLAKASSKQIICIDGDGASLMHLGSWCTIGTRASQVSNLIHVIFNNNAHESVGGDSTGMKDVNIASIATACGYPQVYNVDNLESLNMTLKKIQESTPQLTMVVVKGCVGEMKPLMRPTETTYESKKQFMFQLHQ